MEIMEQEGLTWAKQLGYDFTLDDLKAYGEEMKQTDMNHELSDEELAAVVGGGTTGTSLCVFIGVGTGDFSGTCVLYGDMWRIENGKPVARAACPIIGDLWTTS